MPNGLNLAGNYANYTFTIYFLVEMIIKLIGMGVRRYMRDRMNVFDAGASLCAWHGSQGCMYMHACLCTWLGSQGFMYMPAWLCTWLRSQGYCMRACLCGLGCMFVCMHARMPAWVGGSQGCMDMHACVPVPRSESGSCGCVYMHACLCGGVGGSQGCMHTCLFVWGGVVNACICMQCMHACMRACEWGGACMCMRVCMHVMRVCMHVCVSSFPFFLRLMLGA